MLSRHWGNLQTSTTTTTTAGQIRLVRDLKNLLHEFDWVNGTIWCLASENWSHVSTESGEDVSVYKYTDVKMKRLIETVA